MVYIAVFWEGKTSAHTIGLMKTIRAGTELGLAAAKQCTEACVEGETAIVELRPDVEAADFIAAVRDLGWGARLIDKDEFDPDPKLSMRQLQEWNANVEHTLNWSDFYRHDSTWCYFVAAPLRSVALFASAYSARQAEGDRQTDVRMIRGRYCAYPRDVFREWSAALQFPFDFRHNWDAFNKCMADLTWLPGSCYVFFVTEFDRLLQYDRDSFAIFSSALQNAARELRRPNHNNTDEPEVVLNVVFHVEPHKAAKSLERLHSVGVDPIKARLSDALLASSAE